MPESLYAPRYGNSRALIVGIDKYKSAPPLAYAGNDAKAVAATLVERFGFPTENVELLLDGEATRKSIVERYLALTNKDKTDPDDRIVVFFAGHGHTVPGIRGEIGFLVPVDGKSDRLDTLIRWDELTRNAELIPAKHLFFLMDACYGGLALKRKANPPGSARFIDDMLRRISRQVLTAGKADEVVSDGGGARPGHSIFTSYVLDGLEGAAAGPEGVITANGLMAYVYEQVGNDAYSQQTPHYGFVDGDGDFIFNLPLAANAESGEPTPADILIKTPSVMPRAEVREPVSETLKRLIADNSLRIQLDDFVSAQLRRAVEILGSTHFSTQIPAMTPEVFSDRLKRYEEAIKELEIAVILLARWATGEQMNLLEKIFARLSEANSELSGNVMSIELTWYPIHRLQYIGGVSAISANRFDSLKACLTTPIHEDPRLSRNESKAVVFRSGYAMSKVGDLFKLLPGLERRYTARSDYLFESIQPVIEDQLFLGRSYERVFDDFEVMTGLVFADLYSAGPKTAAWGPVGRFGWKGSRGDEAPFTRFVEDVERSGSDWPGLKVGFFGGSLERFEEISTRYRTELLDKLQWF